jgi:hypothetical protein
MFICKVSFLKTWYSWVLLFYPMWQVLSLKHLCFMLFWQFDASLSSACLFLFVPSFLCSHSHLYPPSLMLSVLILASHLLGLLISYNSLGFLYYLRNFFGIKEYVSITDYLQVIIYCLSHSKRTVWHSNTLHFYLLHLDFVIILYFYAFCTCSELCLNNKKNSSVFADMIPIIHSCI